MKAKLKIDWATHQAAKYACLNWHYSKSVPVGKLVKVGAWENDKFIGVVIFSHGANKSIGSPYNLDLQSCCELTRVALTHHENDVSKILALAIQFLKKCCPKIKLIVSYADPEQGHVGTIYQATNWIYVGLNKGSHYLLKLPNGKIVHPRTASMMFKSIKNLNLEKITVTKKHVYLMAIDQEIKKQVLLLKQDNPKRA
jgi:hypothetical protein